MAEIGDHIYIYEVCTEPSVKGYVLDVRYMVVDRLLYADPKRRDIWINAMVRWADSKGRINFIKPVAMEGGVTKFHHGQNLDYDFHHLLNEKKVNEGELIPVPVHLLDYDFRWEVIQGHPLAIWRDGYAIYRDGEWHEGRFGVSRWRRIINQVKEWMK